MSENMGDRLEKLAYGGEDLFSDEAWRDAAIERAKRLSELESALSATTERAERAEAACAEILTYFKIRVAFIPESIKSSPSSRILARLEAADNLAQAAKELVESVDASEDEKYYLRARLQNKIAAYENAPV